MGDGRTIGKPAPAGRTAGPGTAPGHATPAPPSAADGSSDGGRLEALRSGDEAAFAELLRTEGGRLFAVARRLLRDEEEARDVVQEAFLTAVRELPRFRGEARLGTWLHRIVVNLAGMRLRRRGRDGGRIEDLLPAFDASEHFVDRAAQEETSPAAALEEAEVRERVRAAIDLLPEPHRGVLLLRDIEGLDTGETAEVLGLEPGAVRTRLHRARQALRELLVRGGLRP